MQNKSTNFQNQVLESLESAVNYKLWLISLVRDRLGNLPFELGSGLGSYASSILNENYENIDNFTVSEVDSHALETLRTNFSTHEKVTIVDLRKPELLREKFYTSFVSWNVLEHIDHDLDTLALANKICIPGAYITVFVPANQHLYSKFDKTVDHKRRYSKKSLRKLALDANLINVELQSFNVLGYFYWLVFMKIFRGSPKDVKILAILDKYLIPFVQRMDTFWHMPFGQSLVLTANVAN